MAYALFKPKPLITHPTSIDEKLLTTAAFTVHKFNSRPRPRDRSRVVIAACFSEFGCETVGCLYCIPRLVKRYPGRYVIAMGWHGREYLYRHLVDEYWELKEEYMFLRDYTYAFHFHSNNLKRIEESAAVHGSVVPTKMLGTFAVGNFCRTCGKYWHEWRRADMQCPACKSTVIVQSLFGNPEEYHKEAVRIPQPSQAKMREAKDVLGGRTVGIFARGRATYGRNLPPKFYSTLIDLVESRGEKVIWLGEKQSTQPCPAEHVYDHSRDDRSRDLELTLAIISQLKYTIQFWTASSRLAGMMGTPYILFESPEQVYSTGTNPGQEGRRLELTTFGPRKVVISHYLSVMEDQANALMLAQRAIDELEAGNQEDIIGLVGDRPSVELMRDEFYKLVRSGNG